MALPAFVRRLLPVVLLGVGFACARDTVGLRPGGPYPATVRLVPMLPALTAADRASSQSVDSVNVAITNAAGDTLGIEGVAFPLGQDSVVVRVSVVLDSATQTVTAHVDILANGQVVFRQVLEVVASVTSYTSARGDTVPLVSAVWQQALTQAQTALPGRVGLATVYDAGQKEIVGFGGATTAGVIGETWVLSGGRWQQLQVAGPAARVGHGMAYDAGRGVTVLFGGTTTSGFTNDTWEFNAATKTWTQITTTGTPTPRGAFVFSYDAARARIVLFGGYSSAGFLNETWEYNGATHTWTQVTTSQVPIARAASAMVYDAALGKSVLFGGLDANLNGLNDTWTYDGTSWTEVCAACAPAVRAAHGMAYDPAGRVLLFGGANTHVGINAATSNTGVDTVRHNDLWAFDGATWTRLWADNPTAGPSKRTGMAVAFDVQNTTLVVISGLSAQTLESDAWTWNGSAWTPTATAAFPARSQHGMAFDTHRGVAIMYGGTVADTVTWLFDGLAWRPVAFAGPGVRSAPAMAYDAAHGVVVLFGGSRGGSPLSDTWVYDGTAWTNPVTTGAPRPRSGAAMVFDSLLGRIVMFGGQGASALNDTWVYNAGTATWTQVTAAASPSARAGAAVTYDPVHAYVVLFGGGAGLADTWTFNGTTWTQVTTAHAPAARSGAALTYEFSRGRSVLFGGTASGTRQNDLWVFDGTDWTQLYPVTSPSARSATAMVNWVGGSLLLFGGSASSGDLADTWLFR